MELTPMRYKDYVWPHNPRVYTIDYERVVVENKVPCGLYHLQDLGRTRRVMRGEGEFMGPEAYAQFRALANVFERPGAGELVHPLWQAAKVHFVELSLKQEPRPDYVSYTFAFWEDLEYYDTALRVQAVQTQDNQSGQNSQSNQTASNQSGGGQIHKVVKGDTLWGISRKYGRTLDEIVQLNPQIKNPNLILVGQEVRVG